MKMGTVHHICIQTNRYEQSMSFYKDVLGFEVIKETSGFHGRYYNTWLKLGNFMIELQTGKAGEELAAYNSNSEGIVHFCIYVEDIQKEYQRIKALGGIKFLSKGSEDIYQVEGGRLFKMAAPEGTIVEIRDTEGL